MKPEPKIPSLIPMVDQALRALGEPAIIPPEGLAWPPPNWGEPGRDAAPQIVWETEHTASVISPTDVESLEADLALEELEPEPEEPEQWQDEERLPWQVDDYVAPQDEELRRHGVEALAWYCSLHAFGVAGWGIYIHRERLQNYASLVQQSLGEPSGAPVLRELKRKILHHERFHFLTEYFATVAEQHSRRGVLEPYMQRVYRATFPQRECLEEGLANAFAITRQDYDPTGFRGLRTRADVRRLMAALCREQAPAYAHFDRYLYEHYDRYRYPPPGSPPRRISRLGFTGRRLQLFHGYLGLFAQVVLAAELPRHPFESWEPAPGQWFPAQDSRPYRAMKEIPIFLVEEVPRWLPGVLPLPIYSRRIADFKRALVREFGFEEVGGAKHDKLRAPSGRSVILKRRGAVQPYMITQAAKAAGVSKRELAERCFGGGAQARKGVG